MAEDMARMDPENTLCAESPAGGLMANGWIKPLSELRVAISGTVHLDFRQQGLGNHLLAWVETRAGELFPTGKPVQLGITNESVKEDAHRLYLHRGYEQVMAEEMRVCDLTRSLPFVNYPEGITRMAWSPETSRQFFLAY
jgi:GNAT superfamily N-acetyltransferase